MVSPLKFEKKLSRYHIKWACLYTTWREVWHHVQYYNCDWFTLMLNLDVWDTDAKLDDEMFDIANDLYREELQTFSSYSYS